MSRQCTEDLAQSVTHDGDPGNNGEHTAQNKQHAPPLTDHHTAISRIRPSLLRGVSLAMLAALPISLSWPHWRPGVAESLAHHVVSAIYAFPADEMPRCEKFIRQTEIARLASAITCDANPGRLMI
jgi:hypothetical protein